MQTKVQQFVAICIVCDCVRALFNATTPQLHPLMIIELRYYWNLDFAVPLSLTIRYHGYVFGHDGAFLQVN
ncbi:hypothetical protein Mapa_005497 [Marchantia paleacea]|nr:hypothetical protein Mapa_005497 [Marchantia paleacea]